MEITEAQWNELVNQVNGFQTKIEELSNQNTALTTAKAELETKLQEWQTKLTDQQATIDTLAAASKSGQNPAAKGAKSGHKSVRFDPVKNEYIFED